MASSTPLKTCHKCSKVEWQVMCDGCQQWFCIEHFLQHRQELSQQMDDFTFEYDELQQNLITDNNNQQQLFMTRVDRWESKSIEKIKQIADEARQQLITSLDESKQNIEKSLRQISDEIQKNRQTAAFIEIHLVKWSTELQQLRNQLGNSPKIELKYDEDEASLTHLPLIGLQIIQENRFPRWISNETPWSMTGVAVAGGHGRGDRADQLNQPVALFVDEDQTVYIADFWNYRIMGWKAGATTGEVLAGGNGEGNRLDQLRLPTDVTVDRETDSLLICDGENRRVMRWPRRPSSHRQPEIFIDNIDCWGLTMDDQGSLYISDIEKHEVRRYDKNGNKNGTVVAGGHEEGDNLNQLNEPTYLFVDAQSTVYVSDYNNHRVMKWMKGAKEGIVVAGGNWEGRNLTQFSSPEGVWVDECGHVYVVDEEHHRVTRWKKGAKHGTLIVGGHGYGKQANQLTNPSGLFFDLHGHLYVTDGGNDRVQRFSLC